MSYYDVCGKRGQVSEMLHVILEKDSKTAWVLPACLPTDAKPSPFSQEVNFPVPRRAQIRKIQDIDYEEYLVWFDEKKMALELWWGPIVSPGGTVEKLILQSINFEQRSIHRMSGEVVGTDLRGITPDGKLWRSADFPGLTSSVIYDGVSKDVALAYDQIIDSACQVEKTPIKR
jgi:hypothetical protein